MNDQKNQNQESVNNAELFLGNLLPEEKQSSVLINVDTNTQTQNEKIKLLQNQQKNVSSVIKLFQNCHDEEGQNSVVQNAAQETGESLILEEFELYTIFVRRKLIIVGYFSNFEDARIAINKIRNRDVKPKQKLMFDNVDFESILFGNPCFCIYCGSNNNITIDHVIPISTYKRRSSCDYRRYLRVYACKNCNCFKLSNKLFNSFLERFDFAKNIGWTININFKQIVLEMNKKLNTCNNFTQSFFQSFINNYI